MFNRKTPPPLPRKPIARVAENSLSKALVVAKKAHEEYGEFAWFRATKLYKVGSDFAVGILMDPKYSSEVPHLLTQKYKEDGILITFSDSTIVQPREEGKDHWAACGR